MNGVFVVTLLVVVLVAGVYIGMTGIASQFAFAPSRGSAASVICAPDTQTARTGQAVQFSLSGIAAGTAYHWASDEGTTQTMSDGRLSVVYTTRGVKNAWAFLLLGTSWSQVRCSVNVQ